MATEIGTTIVPVKSAWASKINWTQAVAAFTAMLTAFLDIPDHNKAEILTIVTTGQSVLTWVLRTWFTTSVTEASLPKI